MSDNMRRAVRSELWISLGAISKAALALATSGAVFRNSSEITDTLGGGFIASWSMFAIIFAGWFLAIDGFKDIFWSEKSSGIRDE